MDTCRPRFLLLVTLLLLAYGCAPGSEQRPAQPAVATKVARPEDVTGVWQGRSVADCGEVTVHNPGRCHAMQRITLTMFQDGDTVTGSYRCAFGTENCRDLAETGVIRDGRMIRRLLRIRVMLDDGSMCFFTAMPQNDILEGRYSCQWGGPLELGSFRAERSY